MLNKIEEALADFRKGKFVIVVDDENRENEGDFIIAAEMITPEKVNFMLHHGRGVLCVPLTEERCAELGLIHQVANNTSMLGTPFTITVDKLEGCTTGVSAEDRAATIRALADPASTPATFGRPGHINPLYAQERGVLQRAGHTEAAVDLARLAGFQPVAALIEIMNEDGTMARMPDLERVAAENDLKIISIEELIRYRMAQISSAPSGVEFSAPSGVELSAPSAVELSAPSGVEFSAPSGVESAYDSLRQSPDGRPTVARQSPDDLKTAARQSQDSRLGSTYASPQFVERGETVSLPTAYGDFMLTPFRDLKTGLEHVALTMGTWEENEPILCRVHSSCMTGDLFASKRCECGEQLHEAMRMIAKEGKGILVYMNQEGRGIGLMNKIRAYKLQEQGEDTVEANIHLGFKPDERDYGVGAQILREMNACKLRLLTNNPVKRIGLESYGIDIVENLAIEIAPNPYNLKYMQVKKEKMHHNLNLV